MKSVRVFIVLAFLASIFAFISNPSMAYPPFLGKAKKFGAKDCRFCHVKAEGGEPYAARGKWLVSEKAKRQANAVDPEWLVDYKPAKGKK